TQNGTTVTITPSLNTSQGSSANVPFNISLNQGQVYMVHSQGASGADLTGSTVTANFPVAVFGSARCSNVPSGITYCDMLYEQQIPTVSWGTEFVTGRLMGRSGGDFFRVLAHGNGTQVRVNGTVVANLNAGGRYDVTLNGGNWISANIPIAVAQYSRGRTADGTPSTDPFMIQLVPINRYGNNYQFATSSPSVTATNHVTITSRTANTSLVRLDGSPVGGWAPCNASGWSYAQSNISTGAHTIISDSLCGAVVYGWGQPGTSTSYGYYVGTDVPLNVVLPVRFNNIHGTFEGNHNEIFWGVEEQSQNTHYVIRRSDDYENWYDISTLDGEGKSEYTYKDHNVASNTTYYYRVVGYDQNGEAEKSSTISITTGYMANHIALSPNPFREQLNVAYYLEQAGTVSMRILDLAGKQVFAASKESPSGLQTWTVKSELSELAAGTYIVQLNTGKQQVQAKVVKY
ncbi:MAG TPA: T9SS type A sorting domain-containing protein, partial [Bacteroidetes bacterium]|nr:T9SS type A sorting domain-containing protein [Bacteroidota bacterium]